MKTKMTVAELSKWVGLTDDEIYRIAFELDGEHWRKVADAIEAKLKQKNGGDSAIDKEIQRLGYPL